MINPVMHEICLKRDELPIELVKQMDDEYEKLGYSEPREKRVLRMVVEYPSNDPVEVKRVLLKLLSGHSA